MNSDHRKDSTVRTPSQDAQGRWYELLSPTQVLTRQESARVNNTMDQPKKKTKSHGNRKAQHKRRRERRKQQKSHKHMNVTNHNVVRSDHDRHDVVPDEEQQPILVGSFFHEKTT